MKTLLCGLLITFSAISFANPRPHHHHPELKRPGERVVVVEEHQHRPVKRVVVVKKRPVKRVVVVKREERPVKRVVVVKKRRHVVEEKLKQTQKVVVKQRRA